MRLTKEQMDRAAAHLTEHSPGVTCPACGGSDWSLDEYLIMLISPPDPKQPGIVSARDIVTPPQPVFSPVLTLICASCKCVLLFAAGAMGLLQAPKEAGNG